MLQSDQICDGIGYPVELRMTSAGHSEVVVLDFPETCCANPFRMRNSAMVSRSRLSWCERSCARRRARLGEHHLPVDPVPAWRVGGYNEYLYTFFKCLTDERIAYADGWFAEAHDDTSSITLDGWEIQRRCPHLKADLSKFGVVEGNTLTCNLHGWQWNLETGRCLTTRGHELRCSGQ